MKQQSKFLALLSIGALALGACSGGTAADENVAKIGVFLPLTGENADNGQQIQKAIEFYVDEYNKEDNKFDIELVIRDDRGEAKTATNIAREFAEDDQIVAAVGSFTSSAAMAAAPIFDKAGIPQISPTSSHPDFTGMGKYIFRGTPTQDKEASLIAEYLKDELGDSTSSVLFRQDDWGNSASEQFQLGFEKAGGTIDKVEAVAPDSRDFRTMVTSLKSADVSSVYLALQYSDAGVLAQQMTDSSWAPRVITATSLYTHELIELAGAEAVEGWHIPAFFYAESPEQNVIEFVEGFEERNGEKPNAHGAAGYDSISLLGAALNEIDQVGKDGRTALGDALFTVSVLGATGQLEFDENGDVEKEITWLVIRDGEFEVTN
ncbi:ABC transporter substrate-binding protein [Jonesiaceae bacterium BS-20]|uniref:ABC transporter substrate-binding protein n=1 Tax=Jonesiaceae bacterium BS-20 TaxID=3120821 RepID=A0AAU7DV44_9MICO